MEMHVRCATFGLGYAESVVPWEVITPGTASESDMTHDIIKVMSFAYRVYKLIYDTRRMTYIN